jgi:hypothetical protein
VAKKPEPAAKKRMVHYNGFVRLKVTSPRETMEQAVAIAERAGGYVEASSDTTLTLRIPAEKIRPVFADVQKLGDVLARSLTAHDVTDAFTAMELRLSTYRASRDRLVTLLGRARNEAEKLELLREIKRLTEEIDQLELRIQTLVKLASFSRLTLECVPRQAHTAGAPEEIAAFRWIRDLSPFRRDVAATSSSSTLPKASWPWKIAATSSPRAPTARSCGRAAATTSPPATPPSGSTPSRAASGRSTTRRSASSSANFGS